MKKMKTELRNGDEVPREEWVAWIEQHTEDLSDLLERLDHIQTDVQPYNKIWTERGLPCLTLPCEEGCAGCRPDSVERQLKDHRPFVVQYARDMIKDYEKKTKLLKKGKLDQDESLEWYLRPDASGFHEWTRRFDEWPDEAENAALSLASITNTDYVVRDSEGTGLVGVGQIVDIHGNPGGGKSFAALAMALQAEGFVAWIAYERAASTYSRLLKVATEEQLERIKVFDGMGDCPEDAIADMMAMSRKPCLVVIDAVSSSGCPVDGANIQPWVDKVVTPWRNPNTTIVLIDHKPRRNDPLRSAGALGSVTKTALVDVSYEAQDPVPAIEKAGVHAMLAVNKIGAMRLLAVKNNDISGATSLEMTIKKNKPELRASSEGMDDLTNSIARLSDDGMTQLQIANVLNTSQANVSRRLRALKASK